MSDNNKKGKKILLLGILLLLGAVIIAIVYKPKMVNKNYLVLTIDDSNVYLDEVMYYIGKTESEYAWDQNFYRKSDVMDFWEQDIGDQQKMKDLAKDDVIDEIVRSYIVWKKAVEEGIILSNEEKESCKIEAKNIMTGSTETQRKVTGLSEAVLIKILEREKIADIYTQKKTESFSVDTANVKENSSSKSIREYEIDTITLQKTATYETMSEMLELSKNTTDWSTLIEDNQSEFIYESYGFVEDDEVCDKIIMKAAMKLEDGEISEIIETAEDYVIVKMLHHKETDFYEENVENATKNAKNIEFENFYEELKKNVVIQIEEEVLESIEMGELTIASLSLKE